MCCLHSVSTVSISSAGRGQIPKSGLPSVNSTGTSQAKERGVDALELAKESGVDAREFEGVVPVPPIGVKLLLGRSLVVREELRIRKGTVGATGSIAGAFFVCGS